MTISLSHWQDLRSLFQSCVTDGALTNTLFVRILPFNDHFNRQLRRNQLPNASEGQAQDEACSHRFGTVGGYARQTGQVREPFKNGDLLPSSLVLGAPSLNIARQRKFDALHACRQRSGQYEKRLSVEIRDQKLEISRLVSLPERYRIIVKDLEDRIKIALSRICGPLGLIGSSPRNGRLPQRKDGGADADQHRTKRNPVGLFHPTRAPASGCPE